jgi:hypothetical protein
MATQVNFQARVPIGLVNIDGRSFPVLPTAEMIRSLRTVQDSVNAVESGLAASEIANVPAGSVAATTVQDAINELDTEKATTTALTVGLAGKQPLDATLTAVAGVVTAADKLIYFTGVDAAAATDFSSFARTLLDDANAGAARSTLGVVIGTNVQAYSANLDGWAAVSPPAGTIVDTNSVQTLFNKTHTSPIINNPTGAMTLSSGSLGYATGNGGTVIQSTSKAQPVNLNEPSGEITMDGAALAAGAIVSFTFNNTTIAATDVLILNHVSAGTLGAYSLNAACAASSAVIYVRNNTAGSLSEAIVLRFAVFKGATS